MGGSGERWKIPSFFLFEPFPYPGLGRRLDEPFASVLIDLTPVVSPFRLRKVGRFDLDVSVSLGSVSGTGSSVKDLLMVSWANFLDLEQGYKSVLSR